MARLDEVARTRIARRREARQRWRTGDARARREAIVSELMVVYRTDADLRSVDLALDPSERDYGSLWGRRPDWTNYGPVGFARGVTPESWLSTWSDLTSRASIARCGPSMRLPALVVSYRGDNCIFPSDDAGIVSVLASPSVERLTFPGDHYGLPAPGGREAAVASIADWIAGLR